jgi:limonene-1,2-epoxide hydrolase
MNLLSTAVTEAFINCLHIAEQTGDLAPLVDLFDPGCDLMSCGTENIFQGKTGVFLFWNHYLSVFREVHSEFIRVIQANGIVILEWESSGRLPTGRQVQYRGISLMEIRDDKIVHFRTYFDRDALAHYWEEGELPGDAA